ncbi:hypothetical protein ILYODFUR_004280 [Ilyodon furcidens]|uniref:Uncharacterized protein n=1 Tax=Ilyodon furcidens TaxID=33524 RepID=A0ABV0URZ3_9TELE
MSLLSSTTSSWLNRLSKVQQCKREERMTRPISQQVGERKHPAITTRLIMILAMKPRQRDGEERIPEEKE